MTTEAIQDAAPKAKAVKPDDRCAWCNHKRKVHGTNLRCYAWYYCHCDRWTEPA
jgi:hypothetical protein